MQHTGYAIGASWARGDMLQVDYLVLADAAAVAEGKHYIHGAGWDTLAASAFPAVHPVMGVAVRLRIPWADTNQPYMLVIDLIDADGRSILPAASGPLCAPVTIGRPAHVPPGTDQVLPLVFTFHGLRFPAPGTYALVLRVGGEDLARTTFHVRGSPTRR
jgi:uncharacterized protein DUF6941